MSDLEATLAEARRALADEDLHGTLAWIEPWLHALDAQPPGAAAEVLELYAGVLAAWAGDDTAGLARAAAGAVDDADALHRLGHQLIEARALEPALGVLARASRLAPGRAATWHERATAEELLGRYGRSAQMLEGAPEGVRALPLTRYLHAFGRLMGKDAGPAREAAPVLLGALDERLRFMGARLTAMLARHDALAPAASSGPEALARAWHAAWTGEAAIDPLGAQASTLGDVRGALAAVAEAVAAWRLGPVAVTAPVDRDSEILARALAAVLGVPFAQGDAPPGGPTLVATWDLATLAPGEAARLREVVPGRMLYVHQGRGAEEQPLAADLVGRLAGPTRAPWGHGGEVLALVGEAAPARDARPLERIAAEVAACRPAEPVDRDGWRRLLLVLAALPEDARPAGLRGGVGARGRRWRQPAGSPVTTAGPICPQVR